MMAKVLPALKYDELLLKYNLIEPQYPSWVDTNHYGLCLRAVRYLPKGTIVATADFQETDKQFIANSSDPEYKYVALSRINSDRTPIYSRIRGKWAFCNHSCDPNCDLSDTWQIITNRAVEQGQELTTAYDSYVLNFPWQDTWSFECLCDALHCKKLIKEYRHDILYPKIE